MAYVQACTASSPSGQGLLECTASPQPSIVEANIPEQSNWLNMQITWLPAKAFSAFLVSSTITLTWSVEYVYV